LPSGSKNLKTARQPALHRLSRQLPAKANRRRVRQWQFSLGFSRYLIISLRQFRTSPSRRSRHYKQRTILVNLLSYREISVVKVHKRYLKNFSSYRVKKSKILGLPRPALASLVFLILAVNLTVFIAAQAMKPSKPAVLSSKISAPAATEEKSQNTTKFLPHSEPTKLMIPAINLETDLIQTGAQADRAIQMPDRYDVAAWYTGSPTPGELGPAIIVGHVDNYKGVAVFWPLRDLKLGDTITVSRADGTTASFRVTDVKQFPQSNFPSQEVYGRINYPGIRLITCGGQFNSQTGQYEDNIVVFGSLAQS
jgi:sortase (surface protein transpeptidase)